MSSHGSENTSKLWGWAIAAGVLAFLVLKFIVSYTFWPALLLAILIGILVAILLWIGFYRDGDEGDMGLGQVSKPQATPAPVSAPKASNLTSEIKSTPAAKPAAKKPAAKKPAAKKASKPAAAKTAAKKPTAAKKAAKPAAAQKAVSKSGKPEMLKKARASGADNLKQIKGVGPKMEKLLNKMGVYHFDQVAGWRAQEVKWVDENLEGFKGRVSRDTWVKQAKVLAKGGVTEFSKRVKKGGVY